MRIAAFFAIALLLTAGLVTTRIAEPVAAADPTNPDGQTTCSTIFVGGKGVIDSCTGARKSTSRVYPRKPGVPPEGCLDEVCPETPDASTTKANGTPQATSSRTDSTRAVSTPISSQYTPPIDTGQAPAAPQNCDRVSYPDVCIPAAPPYLSCSDIPDRNFRVRAPDPHRFDADGNGIGCEQVAGPTIGR